MADEKKVNLVCVAGEDPTNPRTKGAVATIYNADNGMSLYHLSPKNSPVGGFDSALSKTLPGYTPDRSGLFSFSQEQGTPGRDPLHLQPGFNHITVEFSGTKLSECRVDNGSDPDSSLKIKIGDAPPAKPAPAAAPAPSGPKVVATGPALDLSTV